MHKFKVLLVALVLTLAVTGSVSAQDGGGLDFDFDIINNVVVEARSGEGGAGSTFTVWRGSEPF